MTNADLSSAIPVELPSFTGPLDLLLQLIQKNEVSIYDIHISIICDQYHSVLITMSELNMELAGEFVWMASWLLQLKSRMLLPQPADGAEDPRAELVERLLEYRRVKEMAAFLSQVDVLRRSIRAATIVRDETQEDPELDLEALDLRTLAQSYLSAMERFSEEHPPPISILPLRFTVEQQMMSLQEKVWEAGLFPLLRYVHAKEDAEEAITLVVATLELSRLGAVRVAQRRPFSEIYLRPGDHPVDLSQIDLQGEAHDV